MQSRHSVIITVPYNTSAVMRLIQHLNGNIQCIDTYGRLQVELDYRKLQTLYNSEKRIHGWLGLSSCETTLLQEQIDALKRLKVITIIRNDNDEDNKFTLIYPIPCYDIVNKIIQNFQEYQLDVPNHTIDGQQNYYTQYITIQNPQIQQKSKNESCCIII